MNSQNVTSNSAFDKLRITASGNFGSDISINNSLVSNDKVVISHYAQQLGRYIVSPIVVPMIALRCPYCQQDLVVDERRFWADDRSFKWVGALECCLRCYHWRWHFLETGFRQGVNRLFHVYESLISHVRDFDEDLPEGISEEIAQFIRRRPDFWNTINPKKLERLVADIFRETYDNADVMHVGRPDDGGVDVLFVDSEKKQWLIQVKRRENPKASEPVETVRQLLGTMFLADADYGIVISTADHFTYRAYEAVSRATERGKVVRLIDRDKLDRMLNPILPRDPWRIPLQELYSEFLIDMNWQISNIRYKQEKLW